MLCSFASASCYTLTRCAHAHANFYCYRVVIKDLDKEFMHKCMNMAVKPEILELMQEDLQIRGERERLRNKLDRLSRAQEMLLAVQ